MKKLFSPWWLLAIAVSGTALLAWAYWGGWNIHPHANAGELGQLGDFFGGMLNPLVSALTLFVAISVWRLQKDELELTRKELENSRLAMEEQAATAEQQRREQRFFDLLNIYTSTVGSINVEKSTSNHADSSQQIAGKTALAIILKTILHAAKDRHLCKQNQAKSNPEIYTPADETTVASEMDKLSADLGHYFRVVIMVLQQAEPLLQKDHIRYIELFRSQMTSAELNLLALHLLFGSCDSKTESRDLASKYALLKHLPRSRLRAIAESKLSKQTFGRTVDDAQCATSEAPPC